MSRFRSQSSRLFVQVVIALFVLLGSWSAKTSAEWTITRDEIIKMAKSGVGHGYKWKGATWLGFDKKGWCSWTPCSDPNACICVRHCTKSEPCDDFTPTKTSGCGNYYTVDAAGADCGGYVATCWGIGHFMANKYYEFAANNNVKASWSKLPSERDLRRGDAMTSKSHIFLIDERLSKGDYYTYEASGCNLGINHFRKKLGRKLDKFIPIERKYVKTPNCESDTCNGHGICDNGVCKCDIGFDGTHCEKCEEGFDAYAYPNCERADSKCIYNGLVPLGNIACNMRPMEIRPQDGPNTMSNYYNCDIAGEGGEMVFTINPRGTGKAIIRLDGDSYKKSLGLIRGACEPESCIARSSLQQYNTDKIDPEGICREPTDCVSNELSSQNSAIPTLSFDFTEGERFYVVVESEPGAYGSAILRVDCGYDERPFIGDPCNSATDCDFGADPSAYMTNSQFSGTAETGQCYKTSKGGMCTFPCNIFCPDRTGLKAETFCVADPSNPNVGICVPRADSAKNNKFHNSCEDIPGTSKVTLQRFNDPATSKEVCFLSNAPRRQECNGSFEGMIVGYNSDTPIENAMVMVSGEDSESGTVGSTLNTDSRGVYAMDDVPCGTYELEFRADGYFDESAIVEVTEDSSTKVTRLQAVSSFACQDSSPLHGFVFKSLTQNRNPIAGARIEVWHGLSNDVRGNSTLAGAQSVPSIDSQVVQSDSGGLFVVPDLTPGNYSVKVTADGYLEALASVVVCGGVATEVTPSQIAEIALTPAKKNQDSPFRIVLTWDQPDDLDLHVRLPTGEEVYFYTPCRGEYNLPPYVYLDVDRRAADGPEVMSFKSFLPGKYEVFVHNYSADANAEIGEEAVDLKDSNAEVLVYEAGGTTQMRRYKVPASGSGNTWEVFSFDGAKFNGKNATVVTKNKDDTEKTEKLFTEKPQLVDRIGPEEYKSDCHP